MACLRPSMVYFHLNERSFLFKWDTHQIISELVPGLNLPAVSSLLGLLMRP